LKRSSKVGLGEASKVLAIALKPLIAYDRQDAAALYFDDVADYLEALSQQSCGQFQHLVDRLPIEALPAKATAARTRCDSDMTIRRSVPPIIEYPLDRLINEGNFKDAAELIKQNIPASATDPDSTRTLVEYPAKLVDHAAALSSWTDRSAPEESKLVINYFLRIKTDPTAWGQSAIESFRTAQALAERCFRLRSCQEVRDFAVKLESGARLSRDESRALQYGVAATLFYHPFENEKAKQALRSAFQYARFHEKPEERLDVVLHLLAVSMKIDNQALGREALVYVTRQAASGIQRPDLIPEYFVRLAKRLSEINEFRIAREAAELAGPPVPGNESTPGRGGLLDGYSVILDEIIDQRFQAKAREFGATRALRERWPPLVRVYRAADAAR